MRPTAVVGIVTGIAAAGILAFAVHLLTLPSQIMWALSVAAGLIGGAVGAWIAGDEARRQLQELRSAASVRRPAAEACLSLAKVLKESADGAGQAVRALRETSTLLQAPKAPASEPGAPSSELEELIERAELLALNATIVATQAGEQGKAFVRVAEDLRDLADELLTVQTGLESGAAHATSADAAGPARPLELVTVALAAIERVNEDIEGAAETTRKLEQTLDRVPPAST